MLSITGLGLEDFTALIKSLRFEVKYEKVEKGDEVIILEKESECYKVMFKKQALAKSAKKMKNYDTFKKERKNREKNKIQITDSPFSSLKVLLKN